MGEESTAVLEGQEPRISSPVSLFGEAKAADNTFPVCIITPGWGSSGYYSETVLEEAASLIPNGTHMYWDHPEWSEKFERPERTLRDLAGRIMKEAYWDSDGPEGPGIYSDSAKVFSEFKDTLKEIWDSIGLSVRWFGTTHFGEAEGESGTIVDEIKAVASVDFVTMPGRGGKILQMFESAGGKVREREAREEASLDATQERELRESERKAREEASDKERQLQEAKGQLATVTKERDDLKTECTSLKTENDRFKEGEVLDEAKKMVSDELGKDEYEDMPDITKNRLQESLSKNPPTKDGALDKDSLRTRIADGIKAEADYLAKITGDGEVVGAGGGSQWGNESNAGNGVSLKPGGDKVQKSLTESFKRLGYSDKQAELAAAGRG